MGKYSYGWNKQPIDPRDFKYQEYRSEFGALAPVYDLTPQIPFIYDQGQLGSCTGNGTAKAIRCARRKAGLPDFDPSRLALYYNARRLEGDISQDAGANIRDVVKGANLWGYAPESEWPYDISKFSDTPTDQYYADSLSNKIHAYASVNNSHVDNIKLALSHGYPVVFGIQLYEGFEEYSSGIIQLPNVNRDQYLGGHCMDITGCNDGLRAFEVDNSWGITWGQGGRCWISYDYICSGFVDDLWVIRINKP